MYSILVVSYANLKKSANQSRIKQSERRGGIPNTYIYMKKKSVLRIMPVFMIQYVSNLYRHWRIPKNEPLQFVTRIGPRGRESLSSNFLESTEEISVFFCNTGLVYKVYIDDRKSTPKFLRPFVELCTLVHRVASFLSNTYDLKIFYRSCARCEYFPIFFFEQSYIQESVVNLFFTISKKNISCSNKLLV